MNKVKVFSLIFCLFMLSVSFVSANLARIPIDFEPYDGVTVSYSSGTQICFVDSVVVHTVGSPSIRLEPHTDADNNHAREVDGRWYAVSGGDTISWSYWCKMDAVPNGYSVPSSPYLMGGGRCMIDYYDGNSLIWLRDADISPLLGWTSQQDYVPYGSDWSFRSVSVTVPNHITDYWGNVHFVSSCVLWVQVWDNYGGMMPNANGWFADINMSIDSVAVPTVTNPIASDVSVNGSSSSSNEMSSLAGLLVGLVTAGVILGLLFILVKRGISD